MLTRVMLWWWFIVGVCGFLIAVSHPAQEDRFATAFAFGVGAVVGGGGLWLWHYIAELKRRLNGTDQA